MADQNPTLRTRLQNKRTWALAIRITWVAIQIILTLIFATADQAFFYQEF